MPSSGALASEIFRLMGKCEATPHDGIVAMIGALVTACVLAGYSQDEVIESIAGCWDASETRIREMQEAGHA